MNSIGIVLINYFNEHEVIHFINTQLLTQQNQEFRIFVLNNGSNNKELLKNYCDSNNRISYFDSGKNLGYIGGFLFVVKSLTLPMPQVIILSNSDIEIGDKNFMTRLSSMPWDERVVMLGPSIISSRTKHNQNPYYRDRISTRKLKMLNMVFRNYFLYSAYQLTGMLKWNIKSYSKSEIKSVDTYAIHGSFMIFRMDFIEKYFDELADAPYLFGEEIQFAEVALKHGLKALFVPELSIVHHEHATTKLFLSRKMLKLLKDSIAFRLEKRREEEA